MTMKQDLVQRLSPPIDNGELMYHCVVLLLKFQEGFNEFSFVHIYLCFAITNLDKNLKSRLKFHRNLFAWNSTLGYMSDDELHLWSHNSLVA